MKAEEAILPVVSKQLTFWQAARILRISPRYGPHVLARIEGPGKTETQIEESGGKAAPWKSLHDHFPTALGNPAHDAGFPLSHRSGDGASPHHEDQLKPTKTGHFTCS